MTARVRIERTTSDSKYNPETGDYDGGVLELLYLGRANIDRIASPTRREFISDASDTQMTQVQLSEALNEMDPKPAVLNFQSGDKLTILECPGMAAMVGEQLFMRGELGASEDWAHTLHFGYDSKQGIA